MHVWWMYVFVCVCVYMCARVCACMLVCACVCMCCVCVFVYVGMCAHTGMCVHGYNTLLRHSLYEGTLSTQQAVAFMAKYKR